MTDILDLTPLAPARQRRTLPPAVARSVAFVRSVPNFGTWFGLVVALLGFGLLADGWAHVAGIASVDRQIPYVMSAGFTGIGLVAVGVTVIAIDAKFRDHESRREQSREMVEGLARLTDNLKAER